MHVPTHREIVVVEVFAEPLQPVLDVAVVLNEPILDVFVKFNVVDAVAQYASLRNNSPAEAAFLVSVDDRLTSETRPVCRMMIPTHMAS